MVYFRCLHIERTFFIKVFFTRRVQGVWLVQPFRKNWILSFNTATMAFNSRKSTFLCVFITTHHSFCFPNVLWRWGLQTPKTPPWIRPCTGQFSSNYYQACIIRALRYVASHDRESSALCVDIVYLYKVTSCTVG